MLTFPKHLSNNILTLLKFNSTGGIGFVVIKLSLAQRLYSIYESTNWIHMRRCLWETVVRLGQTLWAACHLFKSNKIDAYQC